MNVYKETEQEIWYISQEEDWRGGIFCGYIFFVKCWKKDWEGFVKNSDGYKTEDEAKKHIDNQVNKNLNKQ